MCRAPCWWRMGGVDGRPIVIRFELCLEDDWLRGRASDSAVAAREFVGWKGLVAAIDALLCGDAMGGAADSPRAGDGGAAW